VDPEIERCCREIAAIEAELVAGNPDVAGLCLALSDWWAELRILEGAVRTNAPAHPSPAVKAMYLQVRREGVHQAAGRLQHATGAAASIMLKLMTDPKKRVCAHGAVSWRISMGTMSLHAFGCFSCSRHGSG